MLSIKDFEEHAAKTLNFSTREFYRNGSLHEHTLSENEAAYSRLRIRPRFLNADVSRRNLSTKFLNDDVSSPIGVAPTAMQKLAHPDGEIATVKGKTKFYFVFSIHLIISIISYS